MKTELKEKPFFFKNIKTYSAEEIMAAGGTTAFAKQTKYDSKELYHLDGKPISNDDFNKAIKLITK